jgi:Tfp pilus assembly protein PilF
MRKTGRLEQAFQYYRAAIDKNPNNLLVRSYMGQGFVELGELGSARQQHQEILSRGGQGTWAEVSLRTALTSGRTSNY